MFLPFAPAFKIKIGLVSAFALILALHASPIRAMDMGPTDIPLTQEEILKEIEEYYSNSPFYYDEIEEEVDSKPTDLSAILEKNPRLKPFFLFLKTEAERGNLKAKVLYCFVLIQQGLMTQEQWLEVSSWLKSQNTAIAARWLAFFEEEEWEGHPQNLHQTIFWETIAAEKGNAKACLNLANIYHYGLGEAGQFVDFAKAEEYYLKAAASGGANEKSALTLFYTFMGADYHYGQNGLPTDFQKAEEFYLKALENGDTSVYVNLASLHHFGPTPDLAKAEEYCVKAGPRALIELGNAYHYGHNGLPTDFQKAEEYYLKALENGGVSAYASLANLYHHTIKNFDRAKEYYLKAIENGDTSVYPNLANLYHYETKDFAKAEEYYLKAAAHGGAEEKKALMFLYFTMGTSYHFGLNDQDDEDVTKAEEYYLKAVKVGDSQTYNVYARLAGFAHSRTEGSKVVHWALKEKQMGFPPTSPTLLTDYLLPSQTENVVAENVQIIPLSKEEEKEIVESWESATLWLTHLGGKINWKIGEYGQDNHSKRNVRSHKLGTYYTNFRTTFEKASICLPQALEEKTFSCFFPKVAVKNHLLTKFTVHNPLQPVSSEYEGLCVYNLWPYQHMVAVGNTSVKVAHEVAEVLTGPFSLPNLINHHRGKKVLLESLRDHKLNKTPLPQDLQLIELSILQKPSRLFSFFEDSEPMVAFRDHLVTSIKDAHGCLPEDTIKLYIDNKLSGNNNTVINPNFEACIDRELVKRINDKTAKRTEKIELLEGIVDSFKQMVIINRPKKVAKFKEAYPDLSDMFD